MAIAATPSPTAGMTEASAEAALRRAERSTSGDVAVAIALPHYRAGSRLMRENPLLLIDWGADTPGRYKSDLTRTIWRGEPSPQFIDGTK
jgi:Xaa-Pro aminopeptidase